MTEVLAGIETGTATAADKRELQQLISGGEKAADKSLTHLDRINRSTKAFQEQNKIDMRNLIGENQKIKN